MKSLMKAYQWTTGDGLTDTAFLAWMICYYYNKGTELDNWLDDIKVYSGVKKLRLKKVME